MGTVAELTPRPLAGVLSPLLIRQGAAVRRTMPVLPEASGPRAGTEGHGRPIRLLVIGESTAAGVGVQTQSDAIARRLAADLGSTGLRVDWQAIANTGATAKVVAREFVPQAVEVPFDLALVMLGVNDTFKLRSVRQWQASIRLIVEELLLARPAARLVLAGVPAVGTFPLLPQPLRTVMGLQAWSLSRRLNRVAQHHERVTFVPTPALGGADLLATDGFHPNAAGYQRWVEHLMPFINPLVREAPDPS